MVRWFALLGLLGLLRLQPIEEVSHPVSVPERTRVEARPGWPAPLPAPTPVAVEREVLRVGVYLGGREGWHPQRGVGVEAPHYDYLPGPDAGWPDLHSADLLQDWIRGSDDLIYSAFLEAAEQDGLWVETPSALDDPWEAMIAAWAAYAGSLEPNGDLSEERFDPQWLAEEVEAIVEAAPDAVPADPLRYCLSVLMGSFEVDVASDRTELLIGLADSPDEILSTAAINALLYSDGVSAADYDRLPVRTSDVHRSVVLAGLRSAVRAGDWDDVARRSAAFEASPGLNGSDLRTLDDVRAMQAMASGATVDDWRTELVLAVRRCHAEDPVQDSLTLGWMVVGGVWHPEGSAWLHPNRPLQRCLADWSPSQPGPQEAEVDLRVQY